MCPDNWSYPNRIFGWISLSACFPVSREHSGKHCNWTIQFVQSIFDRKRRYLPSNPCRWWVSSPCLRSEIPQAPCAHTHVWPTEGRRFPEPGLLCRVSEGFKLPLKINTELNCVQPAGTGSHFLSGFNTPLGLCGLCTVEMNKLH